jgi:hypothetical protein
MWHYVTSFHPCTVQLYNCMQSLHVDWVERLQRPSICFGGVRCTAPKDAQRARPLWPVWHRVAGVAQFGHNLVTPRHRHSQKLWASQSFVDSALKSEHIEWGLLPGHALDVTPCDSNSNHLPLCHFTSKGIQNRGEAQRMQEWRRMRKNEEERWNVIAITRLLR